MRYSDIRFLSKANSRRNKYSVSITVVIFLLVAAVSLIPAFAAATAGAVNEYKQDYLARSLTLFPWLKPIDDNAINAILSVEHVQSVDDVAGLEGISAFDMQGVEGKNKELDRQLKSRDTYVCLNAFIGDESRRVIAGDTLDNSPVYSCIVPSLFYPFEDASDFNYENLEYIDGASLIGDTITLKAENNRISLTYNYLDVTGEITNADAYLRTGRIKLKVVGAYYCSPTGHGSPGDIYISGETEKRIIEDAFAKTGIDLKTSETDLVKYWNDPTLHTYYVVADSSDSLSDIYNEVSHMGYDISSLNNLMIEDSTVIMANILSTVGMFLVFSVCILAVIMLAQLARDSVGNRRAEIGLLKAIGYKNRQIFFCVLLEQFYPVLRGLIIGTALSFAFVTATNYFFSKKSYRDFFYIIDYPELSVFVGLALALVTIIFITCEIISIQKITKIQPREAMA